MDDLNQRILEPVAGVNLQHDPVARVDRLLAMTGVTMEQSIEAYERVVQADLDAQTAETTAEVLCQIEAWQRAEEQREAVRSWWRARGIEVVR